MNLEEPRNHLTPASEDTQSDDDALEALQEAVRERQDQKITPSTPTPSTADRPAPDDDRTDRIDLNDLRDRMLRGEQIKIPPEGPEVGSDDWYRESHFVNPRLHPDEPSGPSIQAIREAWIVQHPDREPPWADRTDESAIRPID